MELSAFLILLGALAYLLVGVSALRLVRIYLDWRDARALSQFRAQCLVAEATQLRIAKRRAQEREFGRAA